MNERVFEVIQEADGGYCAECLTESIVTEGSSWDELRTNVREAVRGYYFRKSRATSPGARLSRRSASIGTIGGSIRRAATSFCRQINHPLNSMGTLNSILLGGDAQGRRQTGCACHALAARAELLVIDSGPGTGSPTQVGPQVHSLAEQLVAVSPEIDLVDLSRLGS
jgi:hypothetical protein